MVLDLRFPFRNNWRMKTILERSRQEKGMSFRALMSVTGITSTGLLHRYCRGEQQIGAEHAVCLHKTLGIPLSDLRPDLWPPEKEGSNGADRPDGEKT